MAFSRAETSALIVARYRVLRMPPFFLNFILSAVQERSRCRLAFFLLSISFPFLSAFCFLILLLSHRARSLWMTVGVFWLPLLPLPLLVYLRIRISFNIVFSIRIEFRNAKMRALSDLVRICYSFVCDLMRANMVVITSSNHVYHSHEYE